MMNVVQFCVIKFLFIVWFIFRLHFHLKQKHFHHRIQLSTCFVYPLSVNKYQIPMALQNAQNAVFVLSFIWDFKIILEYFIQNDFCSVSFCADAIRYANKM